MRVSSGGINGQYEVIGLVMGYASASTGCGGGIDVAGAYQDAIEQLKESAKKKKANGLLWVNVDSVGFVSVTGSGCAGSRTTFQVFAWGTAVVLYE